MPRYAEKCLIKKPLPIRHLRSAPSAIRELRHHEFCRIDIRKRFENHYEPQNILKDAVSLHPKTLAKIDAITTPPRDPNAVLRQSQKIFLATFVLSFIF